MQTMGRGSKILKILRTSFMYGPQPGHQSDSIFVTSRTKCYLVLNIYSDHICFEQFQSLKQGFAKGDRAAYIAVGFMAN